MKLLGIFAVLLAAVFVVGQEDSQTCSPEATHLLIAWTEEWEADGLMAKSLSWKELDHRFNVVVACVGLTFAGISRDDPHPHPPRKSDEKSGFDRKIIPAGAMTLRELEIAQAAQYAKLVADQKTWHMQAQENARAKRRADAGSHEATDAADAAVAGREKKEASYLTRDLSSRAELLFDLYGHEQLWRFESYVIRKGLINDFEGSPEASGRLPLRSQKEHD